MKNTGQLHASETGMSETRRPRRMLRRIGAVLADLLAIVIISTATDTALHATGVYPPVGQRSSYDRPAGGDGHADRVQSSPEAGRWRSTHGAEGRRRARHVAAASIP